MNKLARSAVRRGGSTQPLQPAPTHRALYLLITSLKLSHVYCISLWVSISLLAHSYYVSIYGSVQYNTVVGPFL